MQTARMDPVRQLPGETATEHLRRKRALDELFGRLFSRRKELLSSLQHAGVDGGGGSGGGGVAAGGAKAGGGGGKEGESGQGEGAKAGRGLCTFQQFCAIVCTLGRAQQLGLSASAATALGEPTGGGGGRGGAAGRARRASVTLDSQLKDIQQLARDAAAEEERAEAAETGGAVRAPADSAAAKAKAKARWRKVEAVVKR